MTSGYIGSPAGNTIIPLTSGIPVITEWTSYTPTFDAAFSNGGGSTAFYWRRVGSSMEIKGKIAWGATSPAFGTNFTFTLPAGYTLNTSLVEGSYSKIGAAVLVDANGGPRSYALAVQRSSTSTTVFRLVTISETAEQAVGGTTPMTVQNSDEFQLFPMTVPINEWSNSGVTGQASNVSAYIPSASASTAGLVDTTTQTIVGNKTFGGFTAFGNTDANNIAVKMKKITVTAPSNATGDQTTTTAHGLTYSKIVGYTAMLNDNSNGIQWYPSSLPIAIRYRPELETSSCRVTILNGEGGAQIFGKTVTFLLWYVE